MIGDKRKTHPCMTTIASTLTHHDGMTESHQPSLATDEFDEQRENLNDTGACHKFSRDCLRKRKTSVCHEA